MNKTLILLKPDCIANKHCGQVIERFEKAGFHIAGVKMIRLSTELLKVHYSHLTDKPFFPRIVDFMQSSPVIAVALQGENAVERVRHLLGPTDSTKAAPGTIRGDLGEDVQRNVVHASDTPANSHIELERFFQPEELYFH